MHHIHTRIKSYWEEFTLLLAVVAAIELPLRITLHYEIPDWLYGLDIFITIVFFADIIVHFLSPYKEGIKIIRDHSKIARRYLRGWFWIDILSALPFSLIYSLSGNIENSFLEWLTLLRAIRLLRITRFMTHLSRRNLFNPSILRLFYLVFWVVIFAHFVACIWIHLGSGNAVNTNSGYDENDNVRNYIRALYWTTTTLTTIGYGDISPVKNIQTIFTMFVQLMGAGIYGFLIGNIASLIANLDIAKAQFRERMEKLNIFMKYHNIPSTMQEKVHNYFDYLWESRKGFDETTVVSELPTPLRVELSLFLNRHFIEKVPIFKDARPDFIRDIVMNLQPVVFSPGDFIVRKGEIGNEMYFISKGSVEVVGDDEKTVFATLQEGNFFGEIAILLSVPRTANIRAKEYCDLYMLDKHSFDNVLNNYMDFKEHIQRLAEERAKALASPLSPS